MKDAKLYRMHRRESYVLITGVHPSTLHSSRAVLNYELSNTSVNGYYTMSTN